MKKFTYLLLIIFCLSLKAYSAELPTDLKSFLKKKYPEIIFRIDNSFTVNNQIYIPLIPKSIKNVKKITLDYSLTDKADKNLSLYLILSNGWTYAKLIKENNNSLTIPEIKSIPKQYQDRILNSRFPPDLVVPEDFTVSKELAALVDELPISVKSNNSQKNSVNTEVAKALKGTLYLTSPDTGKIIYLNLNNVSMINTIQTEGAPWEIALDKTNNILFVTDFAKDQLFKLKISENLILKNLKLAVMSKPKDLILSDDGSLIYIIESLSNDFAVYDTATEKPVIKTKLPPNPSSFIILKEANLIAITCPNRNEIVFLNLNDFSLVHHIKIEGGPEKIIAGSRNKIIYTANRNGNTVSIIDIESKNIKSTIKVDEKPVALAINPNGKFLYVGNGKSNTINIIDTETNLITDTISLPIETQFPGDIEVTPDGNWLIITSETTNTISIIDLNLKIVAVKLDVGATTHAAYLVNRESDKSNEIKK